MNFFYDAGIHPGHTGLAALPFFDEVDPTEIDVVLISHFHLDHAASLPYFMEKVNLLNLNIKNYTNILLDNLQRPVYMTHPTKAIYKWFLSDYVRVSNAYVDEVLYDEQDLLRSYDKIQPVDYHQEVEVDGIRFTSYNAGHVLGAAMFLIEIAGVKVLYTGDYSREEDRHLMAAERPPNVVPQVLITESTYGVQTHEPRLERESRFTSQVHNIVQRGGRCLIPVFALGRAQELLLILDEYWQAHPELQSIPIYFASSLAKKCMAVYQTYINMMNQHIKQQFSISNPFIFKHISNLRNVEMFDDSGPCVMVASPGMLQNGLSRELFERWCIDKRNGVLICGYCVEGTLAKHILTEPDEIVSLSGAKLPLRMSVDYISFSAHVDYAQNVEFIDLVKSPNLILVHGEANNMSRLYHALRDKYIDPTQEAKNPKQYANSKKHHCRIFTPKNTETVKLYFRGDKVAKMVGDLAKEPPTDGQVVEGLVVGKDFQYQIMDPEELQELTGLPHSTLIQRLNVPFYANFSLLEVTLQKVFGSSCLAPALPEVKELDEMEDDDDIPASHLYSSGITVMGAVTIWDATDSNELILEWEGSMENDMVSDSVVGVIMSISVTPSPATVKLTRSEHSHDHSHEGDATEHKEVESELKDKLEEAKEADIETEILKDEPIDQSLESEDIVKTVIRFMSGYFEQVTVSESNPKHIDVYHPIGYSLPIDCNSLEVINLEKSDELKDMSVSPTSDQNEANSDEVKQNTQTEESKGEDAENCDNLEQETSTNPAPNGTSKLNHVEDEEEAKLNLSPSELEKLEFETKVKKILLMVKNAIRVH
ncbi:hypothetical protein CONCODRAFT_73380 [Conidiobolus coronatus NRRL 28638]|uniref:Endoribonuclease YSH1 n=1 Tax=Conidiobolus coronatus (strain ATCC 28846 / CBS 209.66 / NRRL 28638) TaxID=796925 RepID=A0A137NVS2_CONC2|nr:hypothetical protein CONCODRAFT_73380 [Conidiobolus coronatus NRRL 28638]|eukprot:KXN66866.1 hypothetical protein CONCODRAFT_73380 [Conidiobolus coronatus NRRL 28638]